MSAIAASMFGCRSGACTPPGGRRRRIGRETEFLRGLGADDVVVYDGSAADWGEPVDIALDGVGGTVDVNELRMQNKTVIGFSMAQFATQKRDRYEQNRGLLWELTASGELRPAVHWTLPIEGAAEAHRVIESRENLGRALLSSQSAIPAW